MKKDKEIIKEDIKMLEGLFITYKKKGQFKIAREIEEELKIMKDLLEKEGNKNVLGRFE